MAQMIIKTHNLCCQAGFKYLLKDINWEVRQGEHWAVFGLNGSGKTTLLSIIAGFKAYTHGELEVFGQPYTAENILSIRQRIGWVSSSFFDRYYSNEPALDIVLSGKFGTFGLDYNITEQDVIKAKALLTELHVPDKINQPFSLLSKGERQNVLIARALFPNPEILVLDEPSSGLDVLAREHLLNTVRDLAQNTSVTIIYVTHYTEEILDIFQHTLLLKKGQVFAQGRTEELFTQPVISEFLGYPVQVRQTDGPVQIELTASSRVKELLEGGDAQ